MPFFDKRCGDRLGPLRGVSVLHRARQGEGFDQRWRKHQISQTQGGEQYLGKGTDIEHAFMPVQPLQGRQRPAIVMEFAVVIIFHNPALVGAGKFKQCHAPCQAQAGAGWILMRRGQVNRAWRRMGWQVSGIHAVAINRHRHETRPGGRKRGSRPFVTRVLHPDVVTGIEQQRSDQVQRLLRTGQHHYLLCSAMYAA